MKIKSKLKKKQINKEGKALLRVTCFFLKKVTSFQYFATFVVQHNFFIIVSRTYFLNVFNLCNDSNKFP